MSWEGVSDFKPITARSKCRSHRSQPDHDHTDHAIRRDQCDQCDHDHCDHPITRSSITITITGPITRSVAAPDPGAITFADHAITITARSAISKIADHIIRLQRIADHSLDHRRRSHRSLRSANPSFFHFLHFTCAISPITKTLYAFLQRVRNQCLPNHVIYNNLRKQRFAIRPITEVKWIF